MQSTEEGKKVARNQGDKYLAVYRRIADPELELQQQQSAGTTETVAN